MNRIRIGLPKGKVHGKGYKLIEESFRTVISTHQLSFTSLDYEVYFMKHRDIARLVGNNTLDFGITSEEWIREMDANVCILKKLDWCTTKMALIAASHDVVISSCVTEFPNIAKSYFTSNNQVNIATVSGSSESMVPTLYDCCIDCVETGNTLKENSLIVLDELFTSNMVLICNTSIDNTLIHKFLHDIHI